MPVMINPFDAGGYSLADAPTGEEIDRDVELVLGWHVRRVAIPLLERDDAALMWARADGTPWKEICWRFGISRATANRRWEYALSVIAWRLNGRQPHLRRGREFVVERARDR